MGGNATNPHWSPDGRWLALDSNSDRQYEIKVIAADGGAPRNITQSPADDVNPSWSSDGHWIYFASDRSGRYEIWKVPKHGGTAVQFTRCGGFEASESPDGKSVYYVKRGQPGVFRMHADGGEEMQVLPLKVTGYIAVTAKGIYFLPDTRTIQLLDTGTGSISTLATLEKRGSELTVSPDDRYLVFTHLDRSTWDLMLVEGFR